MCRPEVSADRSERGLHVQDIRLWGTRFGGCLPWKADAIVLLLPPLLALPNKLIDGGIRDSRLDREAPCGRMMIRNPANGESRLSALVRKLGDVFSAPEGGDGIKSRVEQSGTLGLEPPTTPSPSIGEEGSKLVIDRTECVIAGVVVLSVMVPWTASAVLAGPVPSFQGLGDLPRRGLLQ